MSKIIEYIIGVGFLGAAIFYFTQSFGGPNFSLHSFILLSVIGVGSLLIAFLRGKKLDEEDYEEFVKNKKQEEEKIKMIKKRAMDIWGVFKNPAKKK